MRPGSILLIAITGLIWGVTAMVVIGVTLTLITGEVALPQATAAGSRA
jgi:multiple sugar transport system permease protein